MNESQYTVRRLEPFTGKAIADVAERYGTPVWIYDAERIRAQIERLDQFDVIRFAQKASSNTHILRLMREQGVLVDAVSLGEVERALKAGYTMDGEDEPIVFTADILDRATLRRIVELRVPVNAGSPQMLEQIGQASPGHAVWIRVNPGFGPVTAAKQTPAAKTASMAFGTNTLQRVLTWSIATAST